MTEPNRQIFGFHLFIRALVWTKRVKQSMRSDNPAAPRSTSIDLALQVFRGLVVVRVSQSVIHAARDGWFTHTHTNTPLHAPTSTPRRPISCRPAVKLCIYIMHEAESPERQQQSRVRSGCLLHRVCVCVLGPAWGSRHEPLWGKLSSSSLPPLCSLYETIKMRSINIDDCNFVFVCQNVQLSKFKFKFNNYWNTTEE